MNIIYVRVLAPVNVTRKLFVNKQFVVCFIYKSYICDWMVYSARIFVSKQIIRNLLDERSIIKSWNMANKCYKHSINFDCWTILPKGWWCRWNFFYLKVSTFFWVKDILLEDFSSGVFLLSLLALTWFLLFSLISSVMIWFSFRFAWWWHH